MVLEIRGSVFTMRIQWKALILLIFYICLAAALIGVFVQLCTNACSLYSGNRLILDLSAYGDSNYGSVWQQLAHRIQAQSFNVASLFIFLCAIIHTFCAHYFRVLSNRLRDRNIRKNLLPINSFGVEVLHFMGEIEVVFGIWVIPLLLLMTYAFNWDTAVHYMEGLNYIEPIFVVIIMALSATEPIIKLAENCMRLFAKVGGESVRAWWWTILTIGPISGSLITEPGAMTICALLLAKQFYELKPSSTFAYATLALLFSNISIGGVLTNFAAPPVLMVASVWKWDSEYMLLTFGWKAVLAILIVNTVYYLIFRKEFLILEDRAFDNMGREHEEGGGENQIPVWITAVHVALMAWVVIHNHSPAIFMGAFLLFLGFHNATSAYQKAMDLKPPFLVGFFLAGLVVHGSLQGWWIEPLLSGVNEKLLLLLSIALTSFNDNAAVTFLATLIPSFDETLKYIIVAGAVTGGGLTVIANAPNPGGQAILENYFDMGISAASLLKAALLPTILIGMVFYLLRGY